MKNFWLIGLLFVFAGCVGYQNIAVTDFIPAAAVLNGLKCELARYVDNHPNAPFVQKKWIVQGNLELQVVDEGHFEGGVSGKSILAYSGGAKLDFGLSGSTTNKLTRTANVEFVLDMKSRSRCVEDVKTKEFGAAPPEDPQSYSKEWVVQKIGLEGWLESLDSISTRGATYIPSKYTYGLNFGVSKEGNASGGISLVPIPVAISASAYLKRDDVQSLTVGIAPKEEPTKEAAKGKSKSKGGSGQFVSPNPVLQEQLEIKRQQLFIAQ